jgi:chromosomal replication initiation ATPase DnaA
MPMSRKSEPEMVEPELWPADLPAAARQLVLDLGHTPSHAEIDFVVAEGNEFAYRHVMSFPAWPNPLYLLLGPAKSGKSHLAAIWVLRSGARIADPAILEALAGSPDLRPVLIEDADSGRYPESGLFHLLNQSIHSGRPVLMTARKAPRDWPLTTEDARSRVRLATSLILAPPDDALLSQMFVKLFGDRQIAVEPGLVSYLVRRMERAPNEVVALVDVMDRIALSRGTAVTRAVAAEAIALRASARADDTAPNTETNENHG